MAIYHWESKVITRGEGRTACGAAAYMSCSRLYNDYDGIQHDYTRKGGLVWEHIFLPTMAPAEWNDRETLWNAVEAAEKAKDSQLAREFIVALPVELDADAQVELLTDFIQNNFVSDGMCADVSLHDTDGHNPHAHILLTMRPLNEDGTWQYKTEKEYLCVRNGEERGFTASEFKTAQAEGWEKQYQYKVGKKKTYMAPSEAEAQGLERVSKHPKATRYVRAQSVLGAAKTSAYYSVAPFIGAFLSFLLLREKLSWLYLAALTVMLGGTALVAVDTLKRNHTHLHVHTFTHTHGGNTHTHTITHEHDHGHYLTEDRHGHRHSLAELERAAKHGTGA